VKLNPWLIGGAAVAVLGVGAFALTRKKPDPAPSSVGFDPSKPAVGVSIATKYNPVEFKPVELDLSHLVTGPDWRYHGTVVI
jgi:hypothetical protein